MAQDRRERGGSVWRRSGLRRSRFQYSTTSRLANKQQQVAMGPTADAGERRQRREEKVEQRKEEEVNGKIAFREVLSKPSDASPPSPSSTSASTCRSPLEIHPEGYDHLKLLRSGFLRALMRATHLGGC